MAMFSPYRSKIVIFLHRDNLTVHRPGKDVVTLSLPDTVVQNLEVRDSQKFAQLLREFLTSQRVRGKRFLILIGEEAAFLHSVPLTQGDDPEPAVASFKEKVPFEPENVQLLRLSTADRLFLCGVNKAYYKPVVGVLTNLGGKVLAVVPAPAYGIRLSTVFDNGRLRAVLKDDKRPLIANLLTQEG